MERYVMCKFMIEAEKKHECVVSKEIADQRKMLWKIFHRMHNYNYMCLHRIFAGYVWMHGQISENYW